MSRQNSQFALGWERSPPSPVVFNYAIHWSKNNAVTNYPGVQLSPAVCTPNLEFAYDVVVVYSYAAAIQQLLDRINPRAEKVDLKITYAKDESFLSPPRSGCQAFISGQEVGNVSSILLSDDQLKIDNPGGVFFKATCAMGAQWNKPSDKSLNPSCCYPPYANICAEADRRKPRTPGGWKHLVTGARLGQTEKKKSKAQ